MTSLRQIEANRRKAINSTGPRTPEGKGRWRATPSSTACCRANCWSGGEHEADLSAFGACAPASPRPTSWSVPGRPDRRRRLRVRRLGHVEAALLDQEEQPADAFGHHGREKMLVLSCPARAPSSAASTPPCAS